MLGEGRAKWNTIYGLNLKELSSDFRLRIFPKKQV
jgi:hypothetical protein